MRGADDFGGLLDRFGDLVDRRRGLLEVRRLALGAGRQFVDRAGNLIGAATDRFHDLCDRAHRRIQRFGGGVEVEAQPVGLLVQLGFDPRN